jgi:di/tricarboxylate transporter
MRLEEDVAPPKPEEPKDEDAETESADSGDGGEEEAPKPAAPADDSTTVLAELVVTPVAPLIGRSAAEIDMRARYHINLLAIAHEGRRAIGRLRSTRIAAGDVLLVQGMPETIAAFAADQGCLPLAERPLRLPDRRRMALAAGILVGAVVVAATGLLPTAVAFAAGVLAAMASKVVPPRAVYGAIDWPVIVLLGSLLPVAGAMQTTGLAEWLAALLVEDVAGGTPVIALVLILIVTMTLSDVMNNAATVAVMAPVALGTAASLGSNPDAFLMAVAIGGSCAFLTPIGHQNNTLILGPGGLRFGDYWRLGLPVEVLVVATAVPVILLVWGL